MPFLCSTAGLSMTSGGTRNCWNGTISTVRFGTSRTRISPRRSGATGRNFGARPLSHSQVSLATVRQFQSETDAIREAAEPLVARATLFVLLAFVISIGAILCLTRVDRVITSANGSIVPVGHVNVLQALDPSIIKTIDGREGEQVKPGQFLATLDATFTSADLAQAKLQIASLEAQAARDESELKQQ